MSSKNDIGQPPEVYFHVGLSKTGTTFLQYRVFPKLQGLRYIQRTRYPQAPAIIRREGAPRYLVSREFDQQFEQEVRWFAQQVPQARPIVVFRRHDSYMASQYRRFVKNGFAGPLSAFIDLDGDRGYFKRQDLDYRRYLRILETHFYQPPLVFRYEDLKEQPEAFYQVLAAGINARLSLATVNRSRKHTSYSERQLLFIRRVNQRLNLRKRKMSSWGPAHFGLKLLREGLRYSLLRLGRVWPAPEGEKLLDKAYLERIRNYGAKDWAAIEERSTQIWQQIEAGRGQELD